MPESELCLSRVLDCASLRNTATEEGWIANTDVKERMCALALVSETSSECLLLALSSPEIRLHNLLASMTNTKILISVVSNNSGNNRSTHENVSEITVVLRR